MKKMRKRRSLAELDQQVVRLWLEAQARASMAYDWENRNRETGDGLMHPLDWKRWLEKGPCPGCPCEAWCDRICALRAKWWDDHVARMRRT